MLSRRSSLQKSFDILSSVLQAVAVTYALNLIYDSSLVQGLGKIALLIFIPLKIILYSGIYGALIEVISGEEIIFSLSHIKRNIKDFWIIYTALLVLPFLMHFGLFLILPNLSELAFPIIVSHLNIILLAGLVFYIIKIKYLKKFQIRLTAIPLNSRHIITILSLYAIEQVFFFAPYLIQSKFLYWPNIFSFLREIVQYWQFIYIALLLIEHYKIEDQFDQKNEIYMISPVNAGVRDSFGSLLYKPYPPAFVVLKALSPKHFKFREFNRVLWRKRYVKKGKLVALTCFTGNSFEAYKIAKEFKNEGSTVIMGGPHVTYLPDEALEYCDSVVIGEAEGVWKEVIKDYENGTLKKKYKGTAIDTYYEEVHQELLKSSPEVIKDFLETTRGCKFKCNFCTIPGLSSGRTRVKPTFELVELLERIKPKFKSVYFIDNNIYSDPRYAKELFQAIKPLGMKWRTACTIDMAKNEEMLQLAKDSGCELLLFGYEIFGTSAEKSQKGKFGLAEKYIQFTEKVKKMGIQIKGSFVYGWDTDRLKDLITLWRFCFTIKPKMTVINLLTPIPGSHTYDEMLEKNCITNLNWRSYSFHNFVFRHPHLNTSFVDLIFPFVRPFFMFTTSSVGFLGLGALTVILAVVLIFRM
jgi:radical SAM superfamily enzyme YgiQ (UPF0313 family)